MQVSGNTKAWKSQWGEQIWGDFTALDSLVQNFLYKMGDIKQVFTERGTNLREDYESTMHLKIKQMYLDMMAEIESIHEEASVTNTTLKPKVEALSDKVRATIDALNNVTFISVPELLDNA